MPTAPTPMYTIGHSSRTFEEFAGLLHEFGVEEIIDVRRIPRSRANPQFNADALPVTLAQAGLTYRQIAALGGRRYSRKDAGSPNTFWRVPAFRYYADYAATPAFREGLAELRARAAEHVCAIMCAEAVWWRCHRRIITDYLLASGTPVVHIMGPGKAQVAALTPGVHQLADGALEYPGDVA